MRRALVDCSRCGYPTGRQGVAVRTGRCPRCGAPLAEVELAELAAVVRQQRDAEKTRGRPRVRL